MWGSPLLCGNKNLSDLLYMYLQVHVHVALNPHFNDFSPTVLQNDEELDEVQLLYVTLTAKTYQLWVSPVFSFLPPDVGCV